MFGRNYLGFGSQEKSEDLFATPSLSIPGPIAQKRASRLSSVARGWNNSKDSTLNKSFNLSNARKTGFGEFSNEYSLDNNNPIISTEDVQQIDELMRMINFQSQKKQ